MSQWKELLYKENISYNDLKRIPGASCENYIAMKNYFIKEYGYKEEDLLRGLSMSSDDFNNPKNWINSRDEQLFHINLFKNGKNFFTHYDYVEAGRFFRFSNNSLFMIFFKAISAAKVIHEIEKNIRKFNNEYTIKPVYFKNGEAYLIQKDFPFYKQASVGGECRFTEGVWKANFEIHDISSYSVEHIICSKKLENLLSYGYGHYNFKVHKDNQFLYVNNKPFAERVMLKKSMIGYEEVYINSVEIMPEGSDGNAYKIIENFVYNEKTLFYKDEIYNAPYCLFHLKWKDHSLLRRILNALKGQDLLLKSRNEIEKQIEFTNLQLFDLKQALSESDRRLRIMELYTKNSLIEKIRIGEDPTTFIPEEKKLSVLFNDIRQFTTLTENLNALDVVSFLNEYYTNVNEVIMQCNGEIDKLIGDAVMAGFVCADNSLEAGILIKKKVCEYNKRSFSQAKNTINTGVGVTFGSVISGNIGSLNKLDYTFIGDTVNVSSRIEALTKEYKLGMLVSDDVKNQLKGLYNIRFVDKVRLKGRNKPICVYEVFDYEREDIILLKQKMESDLAEAYDLYLNKQFEKSQKIYKSLLDTLPKHSYISDLTADPLVEFYHNRVSKILENIENRSFNFELWEGIHEAVEK